MNYLLLGAIFLTIGAQASTVREVQTLSMPVTFAQVVIFGFASTAVGQPNSTEALAAAIFPLSSPMAMLARAAQDPAWWPHACRHRLAGGLGRADPASRRANVPQDGAEVGPAREVVEAEAGLTDRRARGVLKLLHQRAMRERTVADPRNAGARPNRLVRRAGEGDDVERQRHFADHAFDLFRIGQPRHEEAAGAGIGEGLSALDNLVDQRIVVGLRLQEQVGPRVDEELVADRFADRGDPPCLQVERVDALSADDLVLEVAADRACLGEPRDIGGALAQDRRSRRPRNRPLAAARPRRRSA